MNLIQPLPADVFAAAEIDETIFPMVQAMKEGDRYWALPTAVPSLALFYYERLMEEAGIEAPPATLDALMEAARAMTMRDGAGNITTAGLTAGMTAQDHHWWREVLVRQFGGVPYGDEAHTEVAYDSEAGCAALEYHVGLTEEDEAVNRIGFMDEPQAPFKAGLTGLHIDGNLRIGALEEVRGLRWGVAELPTGPDGTQSNYACYWVNALTSKAEGEEYDAAVRFMEYIVFDEAMQNWLDTVGELPAKPSVGMTEENASDPVYGPFIRGLEYAHTTRSVNESEQRDVMVRAVERIDLQGQSVADSLAEAAAEELKLLDAVAD